MNEYMKDHVFKEKNHIIKTIKIQILKKLRNLGKTRLPRTENQILRRSSDHVRKPLRLTCVPILKKLKSLERELLQHTQNQTHRS